MLSIGISAAQIASVYVCANLLLIAAAVALAAIRALSRVLPQPFTYRQLLAIGRLLAIAVLLLPLVAAWRGGGELSPLKAQVWSASSMRVGSAAIPNSARIEVQLQSQQASLPLKAAAGAAFLIFGAGLLITLIPLVTEIRATARAIRGAHSLRSIGRVRVLVSDHESVPYAAWIPGHSFIVLPAALLLRPADLRLALRHEAQHHRQRDTHYLYAALLGRALFGLNPAAHWLTRQLFELQEFACDEALARRENHCAYAYCACLLNVAEAALPARRTQLRSFMAGNHSYTLARRIEAALQRPARSMRASAAATTGLLAVCLLAALSAVAATPVEDKRLSRAEAEQLAADTRGSPAFPLQINDAVVAQLNLLLGTPDGREFMRASMGRMRDYEPRIRAELQQHGLPADLLAVPLVESGYRNRDSNKTGAGAGLWMFIVPTARHYGLTIKAGLDQRLDVEAETQAAIRMFSDLQSRFKDWPLTLLAYNAGVSQVEAGMNATHSRDAWAVYRAGYGNDPDYLARVTAVDLILAHPHLLD
ncbi:MAG TPA: M56 and MltD domain-containing protein [Steroidobacteraceae bacterium]|jgi:beta-lactamase regulating signal transducer with metallopeptidase domain